MNYEEAWKSLKAEVEKEEAQGSDPIHANDLLQIMETIEGECKI